MMVQWRGRGRAAGTGTGTGRLGRRSRHRPLQVPIAVLARLGLVLLRRDEAEVQHPVDRLVSAPLGAPMSLTRHSSGMDASASTSAGGPPALASARPRPALLVSASWMFAIVGWAISSPRAASVSSVISASRGPFSRKFRNCGSIMTLSQLCGTQVACRNPRSFHLTRYSRGRSAFGSGFAPGASGGS